MLPRPGHSGAVGLSPKRSEMVSPTGPGVGEALSGCEPSDLHSLTSWGLGRPPHPSGRLGVLPNERQGPKRLEGRVPGPPSGLETASVVGAKVLSVGRPFRCHANPVSPTLLTRCPSSIFCPAWPDASLSPLFPPLQAFAEPMPHHLPTSGSHTHGWSPIHSGCRGRSQSCPEALSARFMASQTMAPMHPTQTPHARPPRARRWWPLSMVLKRPCPRHAQGWPLAGRPGRCGWPDRLRVCWEPLHRAALPHSCTPSWLRKAHQGRL